LLIGAWLTKVKRIGDPTALRVGLRVFSFACGLLAVALIVVMARPALIKMPPVQAMPLRVPAFILAAVLLLGGIFVRGSQKSGACARRSTGSLSWSVLFYGTLQFVSPADIKPGTKDLAELVRARAQPGDRVMHYHEFFHDFTFYAQRVVDVVEYKGELELIEDAAARASGRFMNEAKFRTLWAGSGRVFAVARKRDVKELFADPGFRYHLLGESPRSLSLQQPTLICP